MHIEEEVGGEIANRLSIVGLWCIQWHPVDHPCMKVVVQMLEGGENLTMPPNPCAPTSEKLTPSVGSNC